MHKYGLAFDASDTTAVVGQVFDECTVGLKSGFSFASHLFRA